MDAVSMFLERYEALHESLIPPLFEQLTEGQLRARPSNAVNSIVWIIWHMARTEDFGINRFVMHQAQVLDEGWLRRLNLSLRHQGTGMSDDEVSSFSTQVEVDGLRAYYDAVGQRNREAVKSLRPENLDEVPEPSYVRQVLIEEGIWAPSVHDLVDGRIGKPKGWWLAHQISHPFQHYGEAITVLSLLGIHGR